MSHTHWVFENLKVSEEEANVYRMKKMIRIIIEGDLNTRRSIICDS